MSCTEIYGVDADGDVVHKFDVSNAFMGAVLVWDDLATKYLGGGPEWWLKEGLQQRWKRCWALQHSPLITDAEWFVLMSTFDNCVIPREHFDYAIQCFEDFYALHHHEQTHMPKYAEAIRKLRDEGYQGFCVNATSVNQSPWVIEIPGGTPEEEESRPYNVNQDSKHWFLSPAMRAEKLKEG